MSTAAASVAGALGVSVGAAPARADDPQLPPALAADMPPFGFDQVAAKAAALAASAYAPPNSTLVGSFEKVGYDQYRGIRFRRDRDPWEGIAGWGLDLLPPGLFFKEAVAINLVRDGVATALPFDPMAFDYDPNGFPNGVDAQNIGQMGWSGFRLRAPLNRPDYLDEVAVFQGASYFRAVSRGTQYGQSARGLALGTGSASGEEFPLFREYWLHQPASGATSVTVHALLDSKSVAGAYEFVISPGAQTLVATRMALFPRVDLTDVGIAPLTSMFWFGPSDRANVDDYRPAVHDTEGLQMTTGAGQRLWRVLGNHTSLQLSAFLDSNPRGFGLVQRARSFGDYQDLEARYERRPSAWIAPRGNWGQGQVTLVEIPVDNEFNDNIVAFWKPADTLAAGTRHDFGYVLGFGETVPDDAPLARIRATRSGLSVNGKGAARTFVVDFDLGAIGADEPVPEVTTSAGKIVHPYTVRIPEEGVLRLSFEFFPEGARLADLNAVLRGGAGPVSETWLARWTEG